MKPVRFVPGFALTRQLADQVEPMGVLLVFQQQVPGDVPVTVVTNADELFDELDRALMHALEVLPYAKDDPSDPDGPSTGRDRPSWINSVNGTIDRIQRLREILQKHPGVTPG